MNCPDCNEKLTEEPDFNKVVDIVEIIYTCPECGTVFFGTLYREEKYVEPAEDEPF